MVVVLVGGKQDRKSSRAAEGNYIQIPPAASASPNSPSHNSPTSTHTSILTRLRITHSLFKNQPTDSIMLHPRLIIAALAAGHPAP